MTKRQSGAGRWLNPHFVDTESARRLRDGLLGAQRLRQALKSGFALGTFVIELPSPSTVLALGLAGFDFIVLDMEHSSCDFHSLEPAILAARQVGMTVLVRPYAEGSGAIGKILDLGAHGIMAPHVDSAQRAAEVIAEAHFSPAGKRGFSPLTPLDALQHPLHELNESTFVVLQIEGREGLANIESIAQVGGIDALFLGPYDLALSLGVPPGSARVFDAARRAVAKIPPGMAAGLYLDDATHCGRWARIGFGLQCVSFDGRIFASGAGALTAAARRSALPAKPHKRR